MSRLVTKPTKPPSLIRVFTVHSMVRSEKRFSCGQQRLLDAQDDLSLRWAHMQFFWFCHEAALMIVTLSVLRF